MHLKNLVDRFYMRVLSSFLKGVHVTPFVDLGLIGNQLTS